MQKTDMTFWEHLDVLRNSLIKIALAVVICGLVAFFSRIRCLMSFLLPRTQLLLPIVGSMKYAG